MCVQCNEIWTHSGSLQETPNCILIYTLSILGITIIQFSYCNISDARFNLSIHRFVDAFTKEWHWMQLVIHLLFDWTIQNIAILMRHSDLIIYSSYYVLDDVIGLCQFRDNRCGRSCVYHAIMQCEDWGMIRAQWQRYAYGHILMAYLVVNTYLLSMCLYLCENVTKRAMGMNKNKKKNNK